MLALFCYRCTHISITHQSQELGQFRFVFCWNGLKETQQQELANLLGKLMSKPSAPREPLDQNQIVRSIRVLGKEDIELGVVGTQTISWEISVMYKLRRQHHPHPSSLPKVAVWKDLYHTQRPLQPKRVVLLQEASDCIIEPLPPSCHQKNICLCIK